MEVEGCFLTMCWVSRRGEGRGWGLFTKNFLDVRGDGGGGLFTYNVLGQEGRGWGCLLTMCWVSREGEGVGVVY